VSRRRNISTDISLDEKVDAVAQRSDFAALLYTWMIPHVEEDATITGCPKRLLALVCPYRRDKTPKDVEEALTIIEEAGLLELWDRGAEVIYLPPASFYSYQSNIHADKRRLPLNSGEQRRTADNAASLSLSPSPTPSPSRDKVLSIAREFEAPHPVRSYFEEKLRRDAKPDEIRSIVRWCRSFGEEATKQAIGQAAVQGEPGNVRLIAHILKAETQQEARA
jgi:hypothetical protein